MLRAYLPHFSLLFASHLIALVHTSPIAYSDNNLADIDRLRASGASEVFFCFSLFISPPVYQKKKKAIPKITMPTNQKKNLRP